MTSGRVTAARCLANAALRANDHPAPSAALSGVPHLSETEHEANQWSATPPSYPSPHSGVRSRRRGLVESGDRSPHFERKRMLAAEAERAEAGVEALVDDRAEKPDRAARARAKDLADLRALERSGRCWRNTCCDRETGRAVEPNRRDAMRAGAARGGAAFESASTPVLRPNVDRCAPAAGVQLRQLSARDAVPPQQGRTLARLATVAMLLRPSRVHVRPASDTGMDSR